MVLIHQDLLQGPAKALHPERFGFFTAAAGLAAPGTAGLRRVV